MFTKEEEDNFFPTNLMELISKVYRPVIIDVTRLEVRVISVVFCDK